MSLAWWPKYMADDLMSDWGPDDDPEKEKLLSGGRERLHTNSATWDALSAVCEKLTVPEFRPSPNREQFYDDDRTPLDNYLGSVLSRCGPNLQHLYLDFAPSGLDAQLFRNRHRRLFYYAGSPADIEALCRKADAEGGLRGPAVSNIRMRTGLWADAVDMLRCKFARETHSRLRRHLSLYAPHGGEFGNGEGEQEDDDAPESEPGSHINPGEMMGMPPLVLKTMGYVEPSWGTYPLRRSTSRRRRLALDPKKGMASAA
ncbi:hypothetical protein P885DRAFT_64683 [Corynascus similis CBS 632.67]